MAHNICVYSIVNINISYKLQHIVSCNGTSEGKIDMNIKQAWVIDNVSIGTIWTENVFVSKLGAYQDLSDDKVVRAFYFSKADMTIFVSSVTKEVLTWKMGKKDSL